MVRVFASSTADRSRRTAARISSGARVLVGFVVLFSVLGGVLAAQESTESTSAGSEEDPIFRAVQRNDYREAFRLIDRRLRFAQIDRDERISLLFTKGEIATSFGQYDTALETFQQIIELCRSPKDEDMLLAKTLQAEVYSQLGDYERAIALYEEIIANADTDSGAIYEEMAERRVRTIRLLEQRIREEKEVTDAARRADLTLEIARLYEDLENFDAAVDKFREFILAYPTHERAAEAQYGIGQAFARKGDRQQAITAYQWVVAQYPASRYDALALFQLGRLYLALGDPARALETFDRLLSERPTFFRLPSVYYLRGLAYEQLGRIEEAIRSYRIFIDTVLVPRKPFMMSDLGRTEKDPATLQAALEAKIESLRASLPGRLLDQAKRAMDEGHYRDALAPLRKLQAEYADRPEGEEANRLLERVEPLAEIEWSLDVAHREKNPVTKARAYFYGANLYETKLRDYDKAITLYRRAADVGSAGGTFSIRALYRIGTIYAYRLNDERRAVAAFRELVARAPHSEDAARAYLEIGEIYSERDRPDEAVRAFRQALALPQDTSYLLDGYEESTGDAAAFQIARVRFELQKRFDEAVAALREFVRTRSRSPRLAAVWLYMSYVYQEMGKTGLAADAIREAIRLASESSVQLQWIRNEFPEFARTESEALLNWMRRRLARLEERDIRPPLRRRPLQPAANVAPER